MNRISMTTLTTSPVAPSRARASQSRRFARLRLLTSAALAVAITGVVVRAQPVPSPATVPASPSGRGATTFPSTRGVTQTANGLVLNFQDAPIDTVLNELSTAAGFAIVKEVKPEGKVTVVSRQPLSKEGAVSLLNTVLWNAGYVAIQQGDTLKIVSKDVAKRLNIPVRTGSDPAQIPATDELITQVIPLRYADATQLKNDLTSLINPNADFASNASSNTLILTDTSANVRRLVEIVRALDTSVADSVSVRVFNLRFANAASAAQLINDVFQNVTTGEGAGGNADPAAQRREAIQRFFQGGGGGGPGGGGRGGPGGGGNGGGGNAGGNTAARTGKSVNAGADTRTNSIVVTGPPDKLEIVADVVRQLDSNPAAEETTFVYRLRNAQAVNLESTLNGLFNGTAITRNTQSNSQLLQQNRSSSTGGASARSTAGNTGGTQNRGFGNQGGNTQGGGFAGNQGGGANRLSASGQQAATDLAGQVTIIADVDTNSLLIKTSPGNYERVKAILDEMDKPVGQVLIKVLIAEVTHDNGFDYGAELSVLNLRTDSAGKTTGGQSAGSSFNVPTSGSEATGLVVQLLEKNFTATIRALEQSGKLDVLSRPYILASDNQLASITVGQNVPFITSSRTTDLGGTNNTIEYRDVGILLDVIPHINPDGLVILDVAPEISTLTSGNVKFSDDVVAPIINKRAAQTHVAVRTGSTIVIGGLMEDRLTENVDKVPLLGDIPGLGALFRRHTRTKTKTELLIFLTPHVARDPGQLDNMSNDELKGTKLVPNAVGPGIYEEHREGLNRGDADHPVGGLPTTVPAPEPEPIPVPNLQPERPVGP